MGTGAQLAVAAAAFASVAGVAVWWPRAVRSASPFVVAIAAVLAIVGSVAADATATGHSTFDGVLRVVAGLAFVMAGTTASVVPRLSASVLLSVASLLGSGGAWWAAAALGLSLGLVLLRTDGPAVGALTGAALGQAALRLDWPEPTGLSLLVGVAAFVIIGVSALAHVHRRTRRRVVVGSVVVVGLAGAIVLAWGVTALSVRDDLSRAVDAANAGLDAARAGDTAAAAQHFDDARALFARADGRLGSWWTAPIEAVPIASQNARALKVMTDAGRRLSSTGAETARSADPDDIKPRDGVVQLDEVRALSAPLSNASGALSRARADLADLGSPWLVGALAAKLEVLDEKVARGARDARTAQLAVDVLPKVLGGDGDRRYLVVFQTPAEQRAAGGLIGNFAEIAYRDGEIDLVRNTRNDAYNAPRSASRTLVGPDDYVRRYAQYRPEYLIQNVTMSPDFPSVAQVLEGVYPQTGGDRIDGVISFDPVALAELLRLTGSVEVPGFGIELTPDNAADVLLREQYLRFSDQDERVEFLESAVRAVFDRLETTELPGPSRIGEVLGPMAREGRIQIHSVHDDEQAFFRRIGADGALPAVGDGDFVGLVTQNATGNKIDVFQSRTMRYDVQVDPSTGAVEATARITVRNDAPASGLPDYIIGSFPDNPLPRGTSRLLLSLYTPHRLVAATIDGEEVPLLADTELGRNVYTAQLEIPPGGRAELGLTLEGRVDLSATGGRYRLRVWHQATVVDDRIGIRVGTVPGWSVEPVHGLRSSGDAAVRRDTMSEGLTVVAGFAEQ